MSTSVVNQQYQMIATSYPNLMNQVYTGSYIGTTGTITVSDNTSIYTSSIKPAVLRLGYCPHCDCDQLIEDNVEETSVPIHDEDIPVQLTVRKCQVCGEEWVESVPGGDPIEMAEKIYKERHP